MSICTTVHARWYHLITRTPWEHILWTSLIISKKYVFLKKVRYWKESSHDQQTQLKKQLTTRKHANWRDIFFSRKSQGIGISLFMLLVIYYTAFPRQTWTSWNFLIQSTTYLSGSFKSIRKSTGHLAEEIRLTSRLSMDTKWSRRLKVLHILNTMFISFRYNTKTRDRRIWLTGITSTWTLCSRIYMAALVRFISDMRLTT